MALFIGIDLGTSGCRAIAIDENGKIQGNAATSLPAPIRNTHINKNCVEQDPNLWWDAVCICLSELTKRINSKDVTAIAVDGTSATLLLTDESGVPLGPALMYNDARAISQADLISQVTPVNTAARGATCALAKLLWFYKEGFYKEGFTQKGENKKQKDRTRYALHQADWITAKFCGRYGLSDYNNALKLGYDAEQKSWPPWVKDLLNNSKVPARILPEVVRPGTHICDITPELAHQFNLPMSTQIIAGTTDSTASFMATGASKKGEAVTSLGSTLVLKVISDTPVFAPEYGVYSQPLFNANGEQWLVGGASNSGGSVLRQYFSLQQLQEMTPQLTPEKPTGLEYYPLPWVGERFPVNDVQLKPQLDPRPENDVIFFQGILEGIAHIEAKGYQLLAKLGAPYPASIRTTGGGAKNPAWTIIRKAMLEKTVFDKIMLANESSHIELIENTQTEAAYGAAILAMTGIGSNSNGEI